MEDGGMPLADTLKAYEQGEKLAEGLKKELAAAEERLTVLNGGNEA
ncbi:MAG: exodeoxyribonuclease VII small subunit [Clostridia bacterium]|nr:exodeoxyribonuclease VII small subunit [Clostridia bacterium]